MSSDSSNEALAAVKAVFDLRAPGRFILRPAVSAFRILTILPAPGRDTSALVRSLPFFPAIGLFLGAIAHYLSLLQGFFALAAVDLIAFFALAIITVLTGAMHIDGLADTADGFGGGSSAEKIIEIFRDSRVGSFGVIAIVMDFALKWWCWRFFFMNNGTVFIIGSLAASRWIQSCSLGFLPKARPDGLASVFAGSGALLKLAIALSGMVVLAPLAFSSALVPFAFALLCMIAVVSAFSWYCVKRIGGVSGDCIGAINEIAELSFLAGAVLYMNAS